LFKIERCLLVKGFTLQVPGVLSETTLSRLWTKESNGSRRQDRLIGDFKRHGHCFAFCYDFVAQSSDQFLARSPTFTGWLQAHQGSSRSQYEQARRSRRVSMVRRGVAGIRKGSSWCPTSHYLSLVETERPDLVITDIEMPSLEGSGFSRNGLSAIAANEASHPPQMPVSWRPAGWQSESVSLRWRLQLDSPSV
jgi:hypothetical protein